MSQRSGAQVRWDFPDTQDVYLSQVSTPNRDFRADGRIRWFVYQRSANSDDDWERIARVYEDQQTKQDWRTVGRGDVMGLGIQIDG